MKEIFSDIVENLRWDGINPCGGGSTVAYTEKLRAALPGFVARHGIHSMMDVPCGDYSWMSLVAWPPGFRYCGGDIVASVIGKNTATYQGVDFRIFDITQDPIPAVDMLFVRDCLFHFSNADLHKTIKNIAASSVKSVLTTSYLPRHADNRDIDTGGFRPLRLEAAPWNFPEPIDTLADGPDPVIRSMNLWPRSVFERYADEHQ